MTRPPVPRLGDYGRPGRRVVRCIETVLTADGDLSRGELRDPSDPIVKRYPSLFAAWSPPSFPTEEIQ